jgi:DNA (cytosine-5)-methyltransferase 1
MAWHPLGWEPSFFSEIEKFPCAVLDHHYPQVPNLGDMTKFQEWRDNAIDLLVGGTPCQSFSVAGLRAGLADPRGNLMLTYLAIAARYQPRWLVWENVPGVLSSNGGRDFGTFLRGLAELGYGFAYRVLDAQFCRAHGYEWAVPQRRRRVFVVGYLGDWRRAAAVLFDGASMRGDPAPRREAGQRVAPTISSRPTGGGGLGTDFDLDGGLIANSGDVGYCLTASAQQSLDAETETLLAQPIVMMERGRADGPSLETRQDGTANAILTPNGGRGGLGVGAVAYGIQAGALRENPSSGPDGIGIQSDIAYTVEARAEVQAVAFAENSRGELRLQGGDGAVSPQLTTGGGKPGQGQPCVAEAWAVRRLTPRECERLQGFPDHFTAIPYRGKTAADGPRYKALGNSMAVNVMRVIGTRIAMVDAIAEREAAA